jgi:hypothetical protein
MRPAAALFLAILVMLGPGSDTPAAQVPAGPASAHVTIPFLASATKPADLGFEGAECDVDKTGDSMACQFQQVFLTTSDVVADTCLVTTSRYERSFRRQSAARWVSTEGPAGPCGLLDVVTLQDEGGVRWTMTMQKVVTADATPACRSLTVPSETLGWQNIRRPLPCRFVQPGALGR